MLLICLPLWLGLAFAWVRSYRVADSFWWNQPNRARAAVVSDGSLELYSRQVGPNAPFRIMGDRGHHAQEPSRARPAESGLPTAWEHLGFGYAAGPDPFGSTRIVVVPFWAIGPVVGLAPVCLSSLIRRRRVARLRRQNRCTRCGYSLTGNLSGTCPECGTLAAVSTASAEVPAPAIRRARGRRSFIDSGHVAHSLPTHENQPRMARRLPPRPD